MVKRRRFPGFGFRVPVRGCEDVMGVILVVVVCLTKSSGQVRTHIVLIEQTGRALVLVVGIICRS